MAARTQKVELSERWRTKQAVSMLANRLADHASGKIALEPTQVKSIEILLSKTCPSLSSIEQTIIDDRDAVPESELLGTLHALISSSPAVVDALLAAIIRHDPGAIPRALAAAPAIIDQMPAVAGVGDQPNAIAQCSATLPKK